MKIYLGSNLSACKLDNLFCLTHKTPINIGQYKSSQTIRPFGFHITNKTHFLLNLRLVGNTKFYILRRICIKLNGAEDYIKDKLDICRNSKLQIVERHKSLLQFPLWKAKRELLPSAPIQTDINTQFWLWMTVAVLNREKEKYKWEQSFFLWKQARV